MENQNKDIFDYDSYLKSKGKKKPSRKKSGTNAAGKTKFVPTSNETEEQKDTTLEKLKEEGRESIENIKRMFDDALDSSAEEIAEINADEEEPALPASSTDPAGAKRVLYLIAGIVITLLAIIGLVATVNFSAGKIKEFTDNTQQKNEFAKFIYPIVICDPAPFDQTVKLRSDTMITAAIWDIILYEDKSKYESDFDYIIVPELDVEQHATKLFGNGLSFTHASILGADIQFYYEEAIKSYRIPANPRYFTYSPYIENISRVGERYTLTVGYVSPTPAWLTLTSDEAPKPEKYVEYVVSKRGDDCTLVAIQPSDMESERYGL